MRKLVLVAVGLLASLQGAQAIELPHHSLTERVIDRHQITHTTVTVDGSGAATIHTKFSNGKKLDGDHFVVRTIFRAKNGSVLGVVEQKKGLNATLGGGTKEGHVTNTLKLTPEQWAQVAKIDVDARTFDQRNDKEFWDAVRKAVEIIFAMKGGDETFTPSSPRTEPLTGYRFHQVY